MSRFATCCQCITQNPKQSLNASLEVEDHDSIAFWGNYWKLSGFKVTTCNQMLPTQASTVFFPPHIKPKFEPILFHKIGKTKIWMDAWPCPLLFCKYQSVPITALQERRGAVKRSPVKCRTNGVEITLEIWLCCLFMCSFANVPSSPHTDPICLLNVHPDLFITSIFITLIYFNQEPNWASSIVTDKYW